jgi:hypothetical protein
VKSFFNLIGAFTLWSFSGFKGKYENYLAESANYRVAIIDIITIVTILFIIIFVNGVS